MKKDLPSYEELHRLFICDAAAGILTWRSRPIEGHKAAHEVKRWNTCYAGRITGSRSFTTRGTKSRIQVTIGGHPFSVHRIIWTMIHGGINPGAFIDHRNRDPFDNRLKNLREITNAQNQHNRLAPKNNTSGIKGVSWSAKMSKWKTTLRIKGSSIPAHRGYYNTKAEAALALAKDSLRYHGIFSPYYREINP